MSFSIRHILIVVVYVSVGLVALNNAYPMSSRLVVQLLSLATLVLCTYEIWASEGETRVFRIGFVLWGRVYYLLFVIIQTWRVNLGTSAIVEWFVRSLALYRDGDSHNQIMGIVHPLAALVYGVVGGWVTIHFYRKRQRMIANRKP